MPSTSGRSDGGRVDQGERRGRVEPPAQMSWSLSDDDFECRPDVSLDQMAAVSRRISLPEHDVSVDRRAILFDDDVADQGQHFDLLVDGDVAVLLCRPIKVCDDRTRERSDRRELAPAKTMLYGEGAQGRHRLVASLEHQRDR